MGMFGARWSGLTAQMGAWRDDRAGGLVLFAAGAGDSLHYLADIDDRAFGDRQDLTGYHEDVVDLAHVR